MDGQAVNRDYYELDRLVNSQLHNVQSTVQSRYEFAYVEDRGESQVENDLCCL